MRPLLLIFNPRNIVECVDSISRLEIDQAWLTGYSEADLQGVIGDLIAETSYSHYLTCSDDGIIPQFALTAVLAALEDGHPVVTGYSNLDSSDFRVNLTKTPFGIKDTSVMVDYDLYHMSEVVGWPDELVPTCFGGMSLTAMSRDMWLEFPYLSRGNPSDWDLCRRLQDAEVPIVAPKSAFMWHVKEQINVPDQEQRKRLLVGQIEPNVKLVELVA